MDRILVIKSAAFRFRLLIFLIFIQGDVFVFQKQLITQSCDNLVSNFFKH